MTALRDIREGRGWAPHMFAARVGISMHNLAKLESGEKSPTYKNATELSRILQVNPADVDEFRDIVAHYAWKEMRHPTRRPMTTVGVIYFLHEAAGGYIKIGYAATMRRAQSRLRECQTGNPRPLSIFATQPGTMSDELNLHGRFDQHRISRGSEWFRPGQDLLDYIEGNCWSYEIC